MQVYLGVCTLDAKKSKVLGVDMKKPCRFEAIESGCSW